MSLCRGQPARITENAWEHLSPYIGCATVEVSEGAFVLDTNHVRLFNQVCKDRPTDEREPSAKRKFSSDADDQEHENDQSELNARAATSTRETVRDAQDTMSDHGNDRQGVSAPAVEEPWEEEVSTIPPSRPRVRRRVVAEDDDEKSDEEREHNVPAKSPTSPAASPSRPTQPGEQSRHCPRHVVHPSDQIQRSRMRDTATIIPGRMSSRLNRVGQVN